MILGIAVVTLAGVGGVAIWQAVRADAERDELRLVLNQQQRALEKARAAARDQELLQDEIRRYRDSLRHLRHMLPETLELESYLQDVPEIANRHGVEVVGIEPRLVRGSRFNTAEISLELRGEPQRAENAILDMRRVGPLIGAENLEHRGDTTTVRLLRFAAAPLKGRRRYQPCEVQPSRVWFPGLRGGLSELRAEVESACAAVEPMLANVEQVHELETLLDEVEHLTSITRDLVPRYAAPATPEQLEEERALIDRVLARRGKG